MEAEGSDSTSSSEEEAVNYMLLVQVVAAMASTTDDLLSDDVSSEIQSCVDSTMPAHTWLWLGSIYVLCLQM